MAVNALIFTQLMGEFYSYSRALGAYRIATEIRKAGYTCQVVDFFTEFTDEEFEKIISSFIGSETLIVGFSSTFFEFKNEIAGRSNYPTANYPYSPEKMDNLISQMKNINPNLKIVLGGSKTANLTGACDAYAVGFCDEAIVGYMKFLEGKNPFFQYDTDDSKLVFYGDKNTKLFEFTESNHQWHETDHINYGEVLPIELARGCIFRCSFCSYALNGKKKLDFIKTDDILRDEFLRNYNEHGVTRYIYVDDTHNDSVEKLQRIHKIVTSLPFEIEYSAYLRHDLIHAHRETATLLRESGLRSAAFGIETLNHASGKAIGKGLHPEKTKELLYDVWKNEVATSSGFIIGLPYDTPETIRDWSSWLLESDCPVDQIYFLPLYIANTASKGKIWKSEFELSAEKFGYVRGPGDHWTNEHFDKVTATTLANELSRTAALADRVKCGGHPLMVFSNLGFNPRDLINVSKRSIIRKIPALREAYINKYKEALLKQIDDSVG
jgi:hypothetical protein